MAAGGTSSSLAARFASFLATHPRIILGTASQSRRAIMDELSRQYTFEYEVIKADIGGAIGWCEFIPRSVLV